MIFVKKKHEHPSKSVWLFGWFVLEHARNMVQEILNPSLDHLGILDLHSCFLDLVYDIALYPKSMDIGLRLWWWWWWWLWCCCCCCCCCVHVPKKQCASIPQPHTPSLVMWPAWVEACTDPKFRIKIFGRTHSSGKFMMNILSDINLPLAQSPIPLYVSGKGQHTCPIITPQKWSVWYCWMVMSTLSFAPLPLLLPRKGNVDFTLGGVLNWWNVNLPHELLTLELKSETLMIL